MSEAHELKKALLQARMAMHQNGFALAELQLKVLEDEHAAELAAAKKSKRSKPVGG